MRTTLLIILCHLLLCVACTKTPKADDDSKEESDASLSHTGIQSQAFVDSAFASFGNNPDKEWAIFFQELHGNVKTVTYGYCILSPYKMQIDFNAFGEITDITCREPKDNSDVEVKRAPESYCDPGTIKYWMGWISLQFSPSVKDKDPQINTLGDLCEDLYKLRYDSDYKLTKIDAHYEYYVDFESENKEIEDLTFKVKFNEIDAHGNWTSMSLISKDSTYNEVINRELTYYDFERPTLIKTKSKNKVFCYFPGEFGGNGILYFDIDSKNWSPLLPPDYQDYNTDFMFFTYKDYRVVGDHLYLIFYTNAAGLIGLNASCGIFDYNIQDGSWTELTYGGENCKFVGNKIKVYNYEIIDYDAHITKEIITWIDMSGDVSMRLERRGLR